MQSGHAAQAADKDQVIVSPTLIYILIDLLLLWTQLKYSTYFLGFHLKIQSCNYLIKKYISVP